MLKLMSTHQLFLLLTLIPGHGEELLLDKRLWWKVLQLDFVFCFLLETYL
jgi:hypothetical protein